MTSSLRPTVDGIAEAAPGDVVLTAFDGTRMLVRRIYRVIEDSRGNAELLDLDGTRMVVQRRDLPYAVTKLEDARKRAPAPPWILGHVIDELSLIRDRYKSMHPVGPVTVEQPGDETIDVDLDATTEDDKP